MASGTAMRLSYLPANQAFAFVMGDDIIRLEDEDLFFRSRSLAKQAASRHDLDIDAKGLVTPRHHDYDADELEGANEVWDEAYQKCWKDSHEFRKGHTAGTRTVNRCTREATEALERQGMTVRDMSGFEGGVGRYIPSKKTLKDAFWKMLVHDQGYDLAPRTLQVLRNLLVAWRDDRVSDIDMMQEANHLLRGHGIEYIESIDEEARAEYINMGDTYNVTLVLDRSVRGRSRVLVTDWGTWVEAKERAGHEFA